MPKSTSGEAKFFDTGIPRLNEILTRDEKFGLPFPDGKRNPSSITVIKGGAGSGKTVLSTIIASNLFAKSPIPRNAPNPQTDEPRTSPIHRAYPVYFTFSQPPAGIRNYLTSLWGKHAQMANFPILTPRRFDEARIGDGITVLRRQLLDILVGFQIQNEPHVPKTLVTQLWERAASCWKTEPEEPRSAIPTTIENDNPEAIWNPVAIVDPVNYFFNYHDSRLLLSELINAFRELQWPLILILEDAGEEQDLNLRTLASLVEFESDLIIEMKSHVTGYQRRHLRVAKSRNIQPLFGWHLMRIDEPDHSLSGIPSRQTYSWESPLINIPNPGLTLFPSIHNYLTSNRAKPDPELTYSGIPCLDWKSKPLHADSLIVVTGDKGHHKLPIAFNILCAGLWAEDPKPVIALSFGESLSHSIARLPLSTWNTKHTQTTTGTDQTNEECLQGFDSPLRYRPYYQLAVITEDEIDKLPTNKTSLVVFAQIKEEIHIRIFNKRGEMHHKNVTSILDKNKLSSLKEQIANCHPGANQTLSLIDTQKIINDCFSAIDFTDLSREMSTIWIHRPINQDHPAHIPLYELDFRPGFLAVEEFLWMLENLITQLQPSRILIENTAQLSLRFPELAEQDLLIAALQSLARKHNIMFIVDAVTDAGCSKLLPDGAAVQADVLFSLGHFDEVGLGGKESWFHAAYREWNTMKDEDVENQSDESEPPNKTESDECASWCFGDLKRYERALLTQLKRSDVRSKLYDNTIMAVSVGDMISPTDTQPRLAIWEVSPHKATDAENESATNKPQASKGSGKK